MQQPNSIAQTYLRLVDLGTDEEMASDRWRIARTVVLSAMAVTVAGLAMTATFDHAYAKDGGGGGATAPQAPGAQGGATAPSVATPTVAVATPTVATPTVATPVLGGVGSAAADAPTAPTAPANPLGGIADFFRNLF